MKIETLKSFEVGERLDKAVAAAYPQYSRSSIEKLISNGDITVNNEPKPTRYKLKLNDVVRLDFSYLEQPIQKLTIPVIYEGDGVIVLNKPTGVLTHSKGEFNKEGTVATFIQPKLEGSEEWKATNRAGIVHRLDRATSGVIICAKNKEAEDYLKGQFSKRNVKKTYYALIHGQLPVAEGTIDMPIERNPKKPATFRTGSNGKPAQTNFKTIRSKNNYTLVELQPKTGRTHQLRVHLAHFRLPIVGDTFYNGEPADRLMLHAETLELTLPGGNRRTFSAPIPNEFMDLQ